MRRTRRHEEGDWQVKLVLHYDGRNFYGWQAQRNRRTVQGELSYLLEQVCGPPRKVTGAGRTDRGVHATGQVASARIPERFDVEELQRALNALAPRDLWVARAERVGADFHPRYDATSRTYVYKLGVHRETRSPFRAPWCWPLAREVDLARMGEAAGALLGTHDFEGFSKSGQPQRGSRCQVFTARCRQSSQEPGIVEFEISADRFLHRMVRYMVATLVEIGLGRRPVSEIARILNQEPGVRSAAPAVAQGLWLTRIDYEK